MSIGNDAGSRLATKHCIPCEGGIPPLEVDVQQKLSEELDEGWRIVDGHHLERRFTFDDFMTPLALTNQIAELAEEEGHHPELTLTWGRLDVKIWTHKIDGLTESDFILAAKIDRLEDSAGGS